MLTRSLVLIAFMTQLAGCMTIPQTRTLADPAAAQQAKSFPRYSSHANIYVQRPHSVRYETYYDVFIDDKQVSQLQVGQMTSLKAQPGRYRFRITEFHPERRLQDDRVSEFELDVQAGSQVFVTCGDNREWDASDRYMLKPAACGEGGERRWVEQNGVTFCGKPKPDFRAERELKWHGVVYGRDEFNNCRLLKDASRFSKATYGAHDNHATVVVADVAEVAPVAGAAVPRSMTAATAVSPAPKAAKPAITATEFSKLQAAATCKLKNAHWAYTAKSCKQGLAHGKGSAVDSKGLKFIGSFAAGERVKGEIHQNGEMIFSGSLVDDKPDGNAICLYEGEYEECRFFKGKRIDTLYKIRKENAAMKQELARNRSTTSARVSSKAPGITDYAVDALQKEAADRAANFIFDSLF